MALCQKRPVKDTASLITERIRVLVMDKANRFHSILVEILRLISTNMVQAEASVQLLLQNNHNLANQNWNKMVGRPAAAAASGGGGRRRPAAAAAAD
jgi:hypothetical protein